MNNVRLTEQDLICVRAAASILSNDLREHIPIPKLARKVKLSEKKLKAGFKREFATGVYGYQRSHRFEKVKQMLLANEPLKSIAAQTGYKDEQKLIKAFRNKFNVPPAQWRKDQAVKHTE